MSAAAAMTLVFSNGRDAVIQHQREEIERYKMMVEDVLAQAARYARGGASYSEEEISDSESEVGVGPQCVLCGSEDGSTRQFFDMRPEGLWALTRALGTRIVCNVCYRREMGRIASLAGGNASDTGRDELSDDDESEVDLSCSLCGSLDISTREFFDMVPEGRWAGLPPGARTVCSRCYSRDLGRIRSLW